MYEDILIATDGSEAATAAAGHAFELATYHDSQVHLLYVVDEPPPGLASGGEVFGEPGVTVRTEDVRTVLDEVASQTVDDLAALAADVDVEAATEVLTGEPSDRINRFASEEGIDLIVMGTHGRTGVDRLFHRSVTEHVIRDTPVPVLVVRQAEDGSEDQSAADLDV